MMASYHQHCTPRESSLLGDVRRFHGSGSGSSWWWCWWRRWWRLARGCYAGEWAGGAGGGGGRWAERHWRHGLRHWSVARGLGPAAVSALCLLTPHTTHPNLPALGLGRDSRLGLCARDFPLPPISPGPPLIIRTVDHKSNCCCQIASAPDLQS